MLRFLPIAPQENWVMVTVPWENTPKILSSRTLLLWLWKAAGLNLICKNMLDYSDSLKRAWMTLDNFSFSVTWVCLQMNSFPTGHAKSIPGEHRAHEAEFLPVPSWKVSSFHVSCGKACVSPTPSIHVPTWSVESSYFVLSLIIIKLLLIMSPKQSTKSRECLYFLKTPAKVKPVKSEVKQPHLAY